ncbi:N-acyl-D-amino-acid deacylase family protein [Jiangella alkaliphila]|uniref:N-acyl-D-amino-acid deacylase n=1 Tax=Jiangella alkaliphila TaxID=419479 RepID=A0A1H2JTP2_9ACTN|nr:amidohydrolase family protein [Jiangella alkaliphila]SDU59551.1 N-acyl-D-amino-acid deacylase [Jiangella alkaliphila]
MTVDLLIAGGTVIDGTGADGVRADVAVANGAIVAAGGPAARTIDATGKVVCPGFVDLHTHSDLTLLSAPEARSAVHQGITTTVVGNCGLGVAPLAAGADVGGVRAAVGYLDLDPAVDWSWRSYGEYLDAVAAARPSLNVAGLVGHLPLHAGVVGFDDRLPTPGELDELTSLLAGALDAGAAGLSTGLMYAPLTFAGRAELVALAEVVAARDALFAWHLRDYGDDVLPAVREALDVAAATGVRTQLSHLTAVGRRNWGSVTAALELIDAARADGLDVAVDMYPYLAGNAPLAQRLPAWAQAGGDAAMRARLADPEAVARIRAHWSVQALGWDEITVNSAPDPEVVGHTVTQLAADRGTDPDSVAIDLLARYGNAVSMVAGGRDAGDLRAVLSHPAGVIGSDGQALDIDGPTGKGMPHPRAYGAYPRLLSEHVAGGTLTLPEAIRKCTSGAARRAGITDRGTITAGQAADIVILDVGRLADRATFADPRQYPAGVDAVIVNGEPTISHGQHTGARAGQVLRAGTKDKGQRS